ncbi:MAG: hypothetical protein A2122_00480 [Candidatus Liptonbacteria bacterium GWB1_49_6]|uniref:Uncharacterized protein n=1 Tax=Candidatus Liptonbacteria bacterium GWB1_49_6 TaxID=1798644 RepID=A0A1G2C5J4_9BACT|nr:MAG: hypothetical protein A2122_00480 [Candidatus Liptonbacteria bacterium GWB1_49_6]
MQIEEAFMKLGCERDRMVIFPEHQQDLAYLRSRGLKKNGDKLVFEMGFSGDPSEPGEVFLSTEKDYGKQTLKDYQDEEI